MSVFQIFTIIFPIFAIIGLGVVGKRSGLLKDAHATDTLSAYVYYFALPALLLRLVARTPIADYADLNFIIAYSLPMIVLAVIVGLATWNTRGGIRGMCILTTIFGNVAYMGIPFNTLAFGSASQPITALTIALTLSLTTFWSLFLGQGALYAAQMKAVTIVRLVGVLLLRLVKNPLIASVLAGLLLSALRFEMPTVLDTPLTMLADTAGPTALFALGIFFAGQKISHAWQSISFLSLAKLIALPVLTYIFLQFFPTDPLKASIALAQSAMPMAATNFIFAKQWNTAPELIGSAIVASTLVSFVTLSFALAFIL